MLDYKLRVLISNIMFEGGGYTATVLEKGDSVDGGTPKQALRFALAKLEAVYREGFLSRRLPEDDPKVVEYEQLGKKGEDIYIVQIGRIAYEVHVRGKAIVDPGRYGPGERGNRLSRTLDRMRAALAW